MKQKETHARPAVVVVAPWVYHLRCGIGGGVLCFRLLKNLSEHYDLHWVSFAVTSNDVEAGTRALGEFCASVTTLPLPRAPRLGWARLRQLAGGAPVAAQRMWSPDMAAAIRDVVQRTGAALALFQFPQSAQYLQAAAGVPRIMDVQDVCMVSMHRQWRKTSGFVQRLAKAANWYSWSRYEMRHYAEADLLLALSDTDAGVLRAFMPDTRCVLSPVATEVPDRVDRRGSGYVAMLGNFHHAPNADGLRWLLAEIWPRVRELQPTAELRVAGTLCPSPTPQLQAQGVTMLGFVDDVEAYLDGAAVTLGPYRFGGGVKMKVLDAMARGCPVVATTVGAEGLGVVDGQHLSIASDANGFAAAIAHILHDPMPAERRAAAARAHVRDQFSFEGKTAALKREIDALIARHAANGPTTMAPNRRATAASDDLAAPAVGISGASQGAS